MPRSSWSATGQWHSAWTVGGRHRAVRRGASLPPFAEITRDLRRKAHEAGKAEDTFAAYCFYGDPGGCVDRANVFRRTIDP